MALIPRPRAAITYGTAVGSPLTKKAAPASPAAAAAAPDEGGVLDIAKDHSFFVSFETSIGLSLVTRGADLVAREEAYVSLTRLGAMYASKHTGEADIEITLGKLQVDNQRGSAIFPVVFSTPRLEAATAADGADASSSAAAAAGGGGGGDGPSAPQLTGSNKGNRLQFTNFSKVKRRRAMEGQGTVVRWLHLSVVKAFRGENITKCAYVGACLQEINLTIDDAFIEHLLNVVPSAYFDNSVADVFAALRTVGGFDYRIGDHIPEATDRLMFGQAIQLHPMLLYLTFVASREPSAASETPGMLLLQTIGMAVQSIDRAPVRVNSLLLDHVFGRRADVFGPIQAHYTRQIVMELYKVLGAMEFIVNPVALLSNVADGVYDLFYEPALGLVQSPGAFARGVGRGVKSLATKTICGVTQSVKSVSGAISGLASTVTMDEEWQKERRRRMRQRPKHIGEGLTMAAAHFGRGIFDGLTGVFTKPLEGAKKGGAIGFLKGLGKGIAGIITKPLAGTFDMITATTDAVRTSLTDDNMRQRCRPPRPLGAGPLRAFNWDEAKTYENLVSANNGAYADDTYVYHFHVPDVDDCTYIVSNTSVVCTVCRSDRLRWCAPFAKILSLREEPAPPPTTTASASASAGGGAPNSGNNKSGGGGLAGRPPGGVRLVIEMDVGALMLHRERELRVWCPTVADANRFVHFVHMAAPQVVMALKRTSLAEAAAMAAAVEKKKTADGDARVDRADVRVRELQARANEARAQQAQRVEELDDKATCCSCD